MAPLRTSKAIHFRIVCALIVYCVPFVHSQSTNQAISGNFGACKTPNNDDGNCVDIKTCEILLALLTQSPLSVANKDFLGKSQCGYYGGTFLVCCPHATQKDSRLPTAGNCGQVIGIDKIVGGTKAHIDEFPWMALIEYAKPDSPAGHHCGGTLINTEFVLTAAHCASALSLPKAWIVKSVRLGEWDKRTDPDCEEVDDCAPPAIDVPVIAVIVHDGYNPRGQHRNSHDIALLRLEKLVVYSDFIRPICLLRNANEVDLMSSQGLEVAGWGLTENGTDSVVKLKLKISAVASSTCKRIYAQQFRWVVIGDEQLCAGGVNGEDSCNGDSGGPLMKLEASAKNAFYYQVGIVSLGRSSCGTRGWPGVYTRVSSYIHWIESQIRI